MLAVPVLIVAPTVVLCETDWIIMLILSEVFLVNSSINYCVFDNTNNWTTHNRIGVVMVNVLVWSAVDRGFESRSGKFKDHNIGICYFSAKHTALRRKSTKFGWF